MAEPPPPPDSPTNGSAAETAAGQSKRQRRPSVRLGDPGEQPAATLPSFDSISRRLKPPPLLQSSKTRPLTHLHAPDAGAPLLPVDENLPPLAASLRVPRPKNLAASAKRVRSGWAPRPDAPTADPKSSAGQEAPREGSPSPSVNGDAPSETDSEEGHDWNSGGTDDYNEQRQLAAEDGGVRSWLNRLGLGRYGLIFEIHEVDDEVLPMLTMEDLKDMGINAVGSRRKMYCAIQKLRKSLA